MVSFFSKTNNLSEKINKKICFSRCQELVADGWITVVIDDNAIPRMKLESIPLTIPV